MSFLYQIFDTVQSVEAFFQRFSATGPCVYLNIYKDILFLCKNVVYIFLKRYAFLSYFSNFIQGNELNNNNINILISQMFHDIHYKN